MPTITASLIIQPRKIRQHRTAHLRKITQTKPPISHLPKLIQVLLAKTTEPDNSAEIFPVKIDLKQ